MSIICTNVNRAQRFIHFTGLRTRLLRRIDGDRSSVSILSWELFAGESGAVLGAGQMTTGFFTSAGRADNVCRLRRTVSNSVDIKCERPGRFSITRCPCRLQFSYISRVRQSYDLGI